MPKQNLASIPAPEGQYLDNWHEKFAWYIAIEGMSDREAFEVANPRANSIQPQSRNAAAKRLRGKPEVFQRIEELRDWKAKYYTLRLGRWAERIDQFIDEARKKNQYGPVAKFMELEAKAGGLLYDKVQQSVDITVTRDSQLESYTDAELAAFVAERRKKIEAGEIVEGAVRELGVVQAEVVEPIDG